MKVECAMFLIFFGPNKKHGSFPSSKIGDCHPNIGTIIQDDLMCHIWCITIDGHLSLDGSQQAWCSPLSTGQVKYDLACQLNSCLIYYKQVYIGLKHVQMVNRSICLLVRLFGLGLNSGFLTYLNTRLI